MTYEDLVRHAQSGRIVAVAPSVSAEGARSLVVVTGEIPPHARRAFMADGPLDQASIAIRAVAQVRRHYGLGT